MVQELNMQELELFNGYHWQSKETWETIVKNWDQSEFAGNSTTQEYVKQAKEKLVSYNVFAHITQVLYDKDLPCGSL